MNATTTTTNNTTTTIRRGGLNLNWYDLGVAGLVVVSSVGMICRIIGA